MSLVVSTIASIANVVLSLDTRRRNYLKWRSSPEGRKHFDKEAEHDFWHAVVAGKTDVIDSGIARRQKDIRRLKRELGLGLIVLMLFAGCTKIPIPKPLPDVVHEQLTSGERTYVIEDRKIRTAQGTQELDGKWHIVSPDFIRDHVSNQDDLIEVLRLLKQERRRRDVERGITLVLMVVVFGLASRSRNHKENTNGRN